MIALTLAGILGTGPVIVRRDPQSTAPARYIRMEMRVRGYGLDGTGEMIFDRSSGRFVQRISLGPDSQWIGFDGKDAWFADATGLAITEGNADQRSAILAWATLFAKPSLASVNGSTVTYAGLSRALTVTTGAGNYVTRVKIPKGGFSATIEPSDYREVPGGLIAPYRIAYSDDNGTWTGTVIRISTANVAGARDFSRPPRPRDAQLSGVTSVRFAGGSRLIVIPARIDGGPIMHFVLDTGGQNILTPQAARALHLAVVGGGTTGGAGSGLIATRSATVSSVRVGTAEMHDQPFLIIDLGPVAKGIDGILGYELLARFAARIDYVHDTLQLAAHAPAAWIAGASPTRFAFNERQPQFAGTIDGISSILTIDTGSMGDVDVNTPFARRYDLWKRYDAPPPKTAFYGVGGGVKASPITVKSLRMGTVQLSNVPANLALTSDGVEADPSFDANLGEAVFRQFTLVLDYRNQRLYFTPGGLHDRSGMTISAQGGALVVESVHRGSQAQRAGVLAGMRLTSINGTAVTARDLDRVRTLLNGPSGTHVALVVNGTRHLRIRLTNYL